MPETNVARANMLEGADGSFGRGMGKFKGGLAEKPVLGQVQHQKKRQDKQQRVLEVGFPPAKFDFFSSF
jgi:hypothetical protein